MDDPEEFPKIKEAIDSPETDMVKWALDCRNIIKEFEQWKKARDYKKLAKKFEELYFFWKKETEFSSHMGYGDYFTQIVNLGWDAVPLIMFKVINDHAMLYCALAKITGENPVPEKHQGKIKKIRKDWINWYNNRILSTK